MPSGRPHDTELAAPAPTYREPMSRDEHSPSEADRRVLADLDRILDEAIDALFTEEAFHAHQ